MSPDPLTPSPPQSLTADVPQEEDPWRLRAQQLEECLIKARRTIRELRRVMAEQSRELGALHLAAGTERRRAG